MTIKTKPFNPFDFMDTQEEVNLFLAECFEDENPAIFVNALGHLVKKRGVAGVAEAAGLSRESLYKSFNGVAQPRWDTIHRVMGVLNVNVTHSGHA